MPDPTWYDRIKAASDGLAADIEELRQGRATGMVGRLEGYLGEFRAFLAEHDAKAADPNAANPVAEAEAAGVKPSEFPEVNPPA